MRILSQYDMEQALSLEQIMDQVEQAYRLDRQGQAVTPPRPQVEQGGLSILYMPCFTGNTFGTKILTVVPENARRGLPTIDGLMLLNDGETGRPTALLEGKALTALRTGAVGGVALRHLADPGSQVLGVAGTGTQGFYQALFACTVLPIRQVLFYNAHGKDLTDFIDRFCDTLDRPVECYACASADGLARQSQVLITATPACQPLFSNDPTLFQGKCCLAIGSYQPEMREYPDALWKVVSTAYVDLLYACQESGELSQPLAQGLLRPEQVVPMGQLLEEGRDLAPSARSATFFKSVGMAAFDLVVAQAIAEQAARRGLGQEIIL